LVIDCLSNHSWYRWISPVFQTAFSYFKTAEYEEQKKTSLPGHEEIRVLFLSYDTAPEEQRSFETHEKIIDIQYIVSGNEQIFWADPKSLSLIEPYNEEKDICFWKGNYQGSALFHAGDFALFFPSDAHKTNCSIDDRNTAVKKIVLKIPISAL
jgi:YhcH/YjgK/YiaL family protein